MSESQIPLSCDENSPESDGSSSSSPNLDKKSQGGPKSNLKSRVKENTTAGDNCSENYSSDEENTDEKNGKSVDPEDPEGPASQEVTNSNEENIEEKNGKSVDPDDPEGPASQEVTMEGKSEDCAKQLNEGTKNDPVKDSYNLRSRSKVNAKEPRSNPEDYEKQAVQASGMGEVKLVGNRSGRQKPQVRKRQGNEQDDKQEFAAVIEEGEADSFQDDKRSRKWRLLAGIKNSAIKLALAALLISPFLYVCFLQTFLSLPQTASPSAEEPSLTQREQMYQSLKEPFKQLSTGFPSQSRDFWVMIKASLLAQVKNPEPPQPAAFLLPVNDNTLPTATCLTRRLAEIITEVYEGKDPVHINVTDMVEEKSSDDVKLFLDNTMDTNLQDGSRVVLVHDLEKIPPPAALIFHGYCDNENAPYKDVVFFYIVNFSGQPLEENKSLAQNKMMDMWSLGLEPASYMPVLARIGRNIAFVRPEADETLRVECGGSP